MTEPMTPDDARAREREAREMLDEAAESAVTAEYGKAGLHPYMDRRRDRDLSAWREDLDAYAAAVRAATLAAVRERARGLRSACGSSANGVPCCISLDDVLAALDALAGEGS